MKISINWLKEYVDLNNEDINTLIDRMPLIGNEIEEVTKISDATNLVIGKVLEKTKHPESDHLNVCLVDMGDGEPKQIVCGAPNVDKDQKVIVAKIGAVLPGNKKIEQVTLRGVTSNGMICSLEELGIESKYIPEEEKHGIHVLPDDAIIGNDPLEYLDFNDTVITYELTADRGDLLSMIGMAYETGALLNKNIKLPDNNIQEINEDINSNLSLRVDTNNCSRYLTRIVKNVVIKESPNFIKSRLMAAGIRSINNVVDISNYVMLEYGQPLHFFDYDKLGNQIIVRMAKDNEEVITLDNEKRLLNSSDIVITNNQGIVAVAGVMGAMNTEVDNNTKNIVIESAIFNPLNVRKTSVKVFRSQASMRYEKGIDPNISIEALNRACYLLSKYANGEILKGIIGYNNNVTLDKEITITIEKINRVLGMNLTANEISNVFNKLQFKFTLNNDTFIVKAPSRRLDINIEEDLIEEIGRIHGYENMLGVMPITPIKPGKYSSKYLRRKIIRHKMISLGLQQVITYSLNNKENVKQFVNNDVNYIEVINPMSEDKKILRYSLLPSLLKVVEYNLARNIKDINIFELGVSYYKNNEEYIEEEKLAGMMVGNYLTNLWQNKIIEVDFYLIKGLVEELFNYFGINSNRYRFARPNNLPKEFHIGRSAEIFIDNESIGYIGCINPSINKLPIYMFEISLEKLNSKKIRGITYKEVPKYPSITKDLAFIVDKDIESIDIVNTIYSSGGSILASVNIFDIYTGNNLDANKKSLAFNLEFRDLQKTLTDSLVNDIINKIINDVKIKHNGILRDKQ
jgi:phenylalanyl-tRNA synthetase beta chain